MKTLSVLTELRQLMRYGVVGTVSNVLLYCVYLLALKTGLTPSASAGLSFALGTVFSFVLNRTWAFKSQGAQSADLFKFLIAYGTGFVFTIIVVGILTRWMSPELAQVPNIVLTAILIYALLRGLKFGKANV